MNTSVKTHILAAIEEIDREIDSLKKAKETLINQFGLGVKILEEPEVLHIEPMPVEEESSAKQRQKRGQGETATENKRNVIRYLRVHGASLASEIASDLCLSAANVYYYANNCNWFEKRDGKIHLTEKGLEEAERMFGGAGDSRCVCETSLAGLS